MFFHSKMFPIKKQFQERHINKLLVFSEGLEVLKCNGGQIIRRAYAVPLGIDFQIRACGAHPSIEGENLMAELGEKVPGVFAVSPDPRTPNSSTNLVTLSPAGISRGWNKPAFPLPICKTMLLGSVLIQDFWIPPYWWSPKIS